MLDILDILYLILYLFIIHYFFFSIIICNLGLAHNLFIINTIPYVYFL